MSVNVQPTVTQSEPPKQAKMNNPDPFAEAANQRMAEAKTKKAKVSDGAKPTMTGIRTMKRWVQPRQSAKIQTQIDGEDVSR